MVAALGRIEEIRTQIAQLTSAASSPAAASATSTASTASTAAGASAFAEALSTATGQVASGGVSGQAVVDDAMQYLGVPYVFGGEDASGMDCSGLVQKVFANLGIDMPRVVPDQAKLGTEVGSLAEAQPGDLIVSADYGHIAIYAGNGMKIHAPRPGGEVEFVPVRIGDAQIDTIRRIVPTASASTASAGGASPLTSALSAAGLSGASLPGISSALGGSGTAGGTDLVQAALQRLIAGGAA
jgi:cell wall-associated NlpC family hydrolase